MSDTELAPDELEQLLKGPSVDDSVHTHTPVLTDDEIMRVVNSIIDGNPVKDDALQTLEARLVEQLTISKIASKTKPTPILTPDEIDRLLKALDDGS